MYYDKIVLKTFKDHGHCTELQNSKHVRIITRYITEQH